MAAKTKKKPENGYEYFQYAFRVSKEELEQLQGAVQELYDKFNKDRDPEKPTRRAVKNSDIALKAIQIGLEELRKRRKWESDSN